MLMSHSSTQQTDTIYLSNVRYDSVYVSNQVFQDRSRDTVFIRQHDVEYRYKLLRDTVERIKTEVIRDSIPYPVEVEVIKEVQRKRNWLDILSYCALGILVGWIGIKLLKFCKPFLSL